MIVDQALHCYWIKNTEIQANQNRELEMFDRTLGLVVRVPRGIPQAEGQGYARWHPMDNNSSDKLEDRRDILPPQRTNVSSGQRRAS